MKATLIKQKANWWWSQIRENQTTGRPLIQLAQTASVQSLGATSESGNGAKRLARILKAGARWSVTLIVWIASADIKRKTGPGRKALSRYEFESTELRQGGWGRVL